MYYILSYTPTIPRLSAKSRLRKGGGGGEEGEVNLFFSELTSPRECEQNHSNNKHTRAQVKPGKINKALHGIGQLRVKGGREQNLC